MLFSYSPRFIFNKKGQYSLFAAKIGSSVVSVEPFSENLMRIHKAVKEEQLEHKITLVNNALSDKKNQIKLLQPDDVNIGGQSLLNHKDKTFSSIQNNKYLVETIWLDDIAECLPRKSDGKSFEKGIMKIDIEGFEHYAFTHAKKLFGLIDFQVIFMEWKIMRHQADSVDLVKQLIQFLESYNLVPYDDLNKLNKEAFNSWPDDIIWKKISS
jgi:FkbM family methyltransferase